MGYAWWLVAACVAVGCGPVVQAPADTDVDDGEGSRTGPMGEASTAPTSGTSAEEGSSVPGDPTGVRYDVGPGTSAGTDPGGTGFDPCEDELNVGPLATVVMVVVDTSQTMSTNTLDDDGDPETPEVSRWSMVVSTLEDRLPELVAVADVGSQAFPSPDVAAVPNADACRMDDVGLIPPSGANALLDDLPPQDAAFVGASPTSRGLDLAHTAFGSTDAAADHRILVLTDSAPNCDEGLSPPELFTEHDDTAAVLAASFLLGEGISTHVIGIDVDEGTFGGGPEGDASTDHRARLDELATAGGVPLQLVEDAAALDGALAEFVEVATSCRLRIPPELVEFSNIDVEVGVDPRVDLGTLEDDECAAGSSGYRYVLPFTDTLELCGDACTTFREVGFATLSAFCGVVE